MLTKATLRIYLSAALAAATAAGCAVKVNGHTYQPRGGGGGTAAGAGAGGGGGQADDADEPRADAYEVAYAEAQARKPPAAPADPWAAVDGDQPKKYPKPAYYYASKTANDCGAAHDHCLPADIWFVEDYQYVTNLERTFLTEQFHGPASKFEESPWDPFARAVNAGEKDIAYRTVPATRRHLVKGALAIALPYPARAPASEEDASASWSGGIVESVDWDAGKVTLVGHKTPYWISATRVAVLRWVPGGKVEILGKLGKDKLAVKASETVAPKEDKASIADPWAEVDKKGQPKAPKDAEPLDITDGAMTCDAAHDHCLRPWVWFEQDGLRTWPVRFHDGAFHPFHTDVTDLGARLTGAAYRTTPADPATLARGTTVYFRSTLPDTESEANGDEWETGEVSEVQVEAGVFRVEGDDAYYPLGAARVRVVMWFPGEKAEKAE